MPLDRDQALALGEEVLALAAKSAPGAQARVTVTSGRSANTRFARNEITSTGDVDETEVEIEVAEGKRHAATVTNQTDPESLRRAVDHAARLARLAPEDPEWMAPLGPQEYAEVPPARDALTAALGAGERAEAAIAAIRAASEAKLEMAGFFEHEDQARVLATSAGLRAYHAATSASFTTTGRTGDATGSGWAGAFSHRASDLGWQALVATAVDKARRSAKPTRLEPGRYTVVLEAEAVGNLLGFLTRSLDARRAGEGRSFFAKPGGGTRVGEAIFPAAITLRSTPADPVAPGAPFDDEGLGLKPVTWIDKGTLKALRTSRFWAAKQGTEPVTATSYELAAGGATAKELVKGVKRGVLVTRFWYLRWVDPRTVLATGLTRDGVFLIENGEVTRPVNNFRFNESPVTMLKNADAIGRDLVRVPGGGGRLRVPALRTHEFNLASISDAV